MKIPIIPIIILAVTLIAGGTALFFLKKDKKDDMDIENKRKETAQEFVNVIDIRDKFLYTRNGKILTYIKITPIDPCLLSEGEKRNITRTLTAELSSERKSFNFLIVPRPADISSLIDEYQNIFSNTTNQKQKELLTKEMNSLNDFALSGEEDERQIYIMLYEEYEEGIERELLKRTMEFASKFESSGIKCDVLNKNKIVRLCNLVNNPAYTNIEDSSSDISMPFLFQ